jgi:N-methylhydantoinase A/oxoprolinase/acetone carboxylase beta subunit
MKIGMGIDTGGTYTDAVIYDFQQKEILGAVKALTTKSDLSEGIGHALDRLPQELLRQVELISLSTTLATNACVENKGGRAKLLFINVYKKVVEETGHSYGLPKVDKIFFLNGARDKNGLVIGEPDWDVFLEESQDWFADADSIGIVELNAMYNSAAVEKKAQRMIREKYDIPVICGHELFSDLNSIQRGSSTLLNARLLPIIDNFLKAVKISLGKRNINVPVVIVRSDGSLMSEKFTGTHPVETLLCGPAASVVGGVELTKEKDCLIIDMGGTTTDISLVKGGVPVLAEHGVNVGKWRTFVKGVFTETFGLGGDSALRVDGHGNLVLEPFRVIPLAIAASQWPQVTEKLRQLVYEKKGHTLPLHEFFALVKDISKSSSYTDQEKAFSSALKDGPLIFSEAAHAMGKDIYSFNVKRLENEGVVIRCGLTPTDMMHVKGDFRRFHTQAAELGVEFVARSANVDPADLPDMVYEKVRKKLYTNILRVILEDGHPAFRKTGLGSALESLISESWSIAKNKEKQGMSQTEKQKSFLNLSLTTPAALVGIGAPIHIFLPDVARALGTKCVVPENAGVANALGAIVGNISVTCEINVEPVNSAYGITGYVVHGRNENSIVTSLDEALSISVKEAQAGAREEAVQRGAVGDIQISVETIHDTAMAKDQVEVFLGLKAVAKALGRISL